jgi:hypothetical protein
MLVVDNAWHQMHDLLGVTSEVGQKGEVVTQNMGLLIYKA